MKKYICNRAGEQGCSECIHGKPHKQQIGCVKNKCEMPEGKRKVKCLYISADSAKSEGV